MGKWLTFVYYPCILKPWYSYLLVPRSFYFNVVTNSSGFSNHDVIYEQRQFYLFLPNQYDYFFILAHCFPYSVKRERWGETSLPCCWSCWKASSFFQLSMMLTVWGFIAILFQVKKVLLYFSTSLFLILSWMGVKFCQMSYCIYWYPHCDFFLILACWCDGLFPILNQPCIPGILLDF